MNISLGSLPKCSVGQFIICLRSFYQLEYLKWTVHSCASGYAPYTSIDLSTLPPNYNIWVSSFGDVFMNCKRNIMMITSLFLRIKNLILVTSHAMHLLKEIPGSPFKKLHAWISCPFSHHPDTENQCKEVWFAYWYEY